MIDIATLLLTHGLMGLALWRLLSRDELDEEAGPPAARKPWHRPADATDGPPGGPVDAPGQGTR